MCSPRPWGWPGRCLACPWGLSVFPTPVGMARSRNSLKSLSRCVPHARGDGPSFHFLEVAMERCSPRPWGWPGAVVLPNRRKDVFPTPVGMARSPRWERPPSARVPHARGDGPDGKTKMKEKLMCSPRPWGWPVSGLETMLEEVVFPTPVGMARRRR